MAEVQLWLVRALVTEPVAALMTTTWAWPVVESVHFIGLSLLVGTIFLFDLRLLGVARHIPIAALHRLVPWGVAGFGLQALSGAMFLMTEPDQYVYNPAFHLKMVFMLAAGLNASLFYLTSYRRLTAEGAPGDATRVAKVIAVLSLSLWFGVIIAGRLLTFYRPYPCDIGEPGFLSQCLGGP